MALEEEAGDTGLDIDSSVADIASGLGLGGDVGDESTDTLAGAESTETLAGAESADSLAGAEASEMASPPRAAPKSWAKDYHEHWGKIDPKAQEYIELREKQMLDGLEQYKGDSGFGKTMREVMTPYKAILSAQGLDEPKAVAYLMNAHYRLTQGTLEQRQAAYKELGKNLGFAEAATDPNTPAPDPKVTALETRLEAIEREKQEAREATRRETTERVSKEVAAFWEEKDAKGALKNPYVDEVWKDMTTFIGAGSTLQEAYDKAVYANPVTREKEIARLQTEAQAKLREKAKAETEAARKAAGTNVRGRDTRKAPTEPKGSMEDTMRETYNEIQQRTH